MSRAEPERAHVQAPCTCEYSHAVLRVLSWGTLSAYMRYSECSHAVRVSTHTGTAMHRLAHPCPRARCGARPLLHAVVSSSTHGRTQRSHGTTGARHATMLPSLRAPPNATPEQRCCTLLPHCDEWRKAMNEGAALADRQMGKVRLRHICAGTGGPPLRHLHRTALIPATSAPGPSPYPPLTA